MLLANAPHNGCSRLQQVTLLRASGAKLHRKRALTVVARTGTPRPRLPLSTQTSASLRAAREQAVLQSLLFAGPDQLLLGVLAGSRLGKGKGAAAVLEAELGGGDCDSVREWLNEQSGSTAAKIQGSSWLRPSDVEFSPAARRVLSLAEAGAEAMGSRSVGTYHLLLVLMGAGGEQQAVQAGAEVASTEQVDGSGMAANSRGSTSGSEQPPRDSDLGLLRSLLDVAGVDRTALEVKLLALAEAGAEMPPAQDSQATAAGVVATLTSVYRQQVARAWHERDDNAFRQAHQNTARATAPDPDDEYE